jgi:hypothetical protein
VTVLATRLLPANVDSSTWSVEAASESKMRLAAKLIFNLGGQPSTERDKMKSDSQIQKDVMLPLEWDPSKKKAGQYDNY